MCAVVKASMSVGGKIFISSVADAAIRDKSRASELRLHDRIRRVILPQSLYISDWDLLGLLGYAKGEFKQFT